MDNSSEADASDQQVLRAERLARKLEKREKQRAANIGRAAEMHLARLDSDLPTEEPGVAGPAIQVGCSGWFYWHWRGAFYPEGLPTKSWFPHYAASFSTVELNAPFYAWPTVKTVQEWLRQAEEKDFVYTVKVCELITHVKRMSRTRTLVKDFGYIADLLGERMGCFLFQLPPSFHYSAARLKMVLGQLDPSRRNVVEFRHKSWWKERVYEAFRAAGAIFCSCSGPRLPDELVTTADDVYIRFHGLTKWYLHNYTDDELSVWVSRIEKSGCKRVWAYFNNDRDGHAIHNAREFARRLEAFYGPEVSSRS